MDTNMSGASRSPDWVKRPAVAKYPYLCSSVSISGFNCSFRFNGRNGGKTGKKIVQNEVIRESWAPTGPFWRNGSATASRRTSLRCAGPTPKTSKRKPAEHDSPYLTTLIGAAAIC
jgi:hypothetical protein